MKMQMMSCLLYTSYDIVLDKNGDIKSFIDDIRCRNGNLSVELMLSPNVSGF